MKNLININILYKIKNKNRKIILIFKNWLCNKGKFGFVTKPNFGVRSTTCRSWGQNWL